MHGSRSIQPVWTLHDAPRVPGVNWLDVVGRPLGVPSGVHPHPPPYQPRVVWTGWTTFSRVLGLRPPEVKSSASSIRWLKLCARIKSKIEFTFVLLLSNTQLTLLHFDEPIKYYNSLLTINKISHYYHYNSTKDLLPGIQISMCDFEIVYCTTDPDKVLVGPQSFTRPTSTLSPALVLADTLPLTT